MILIIPKKIQKIYKKIFKFKKMKSKKKIIRFKN